MFHYKLEPVTEGFLDLIPDVQDSELGAEEGLKEVIGKMVTFVALAFGHHNTMIKWMEEHKDDYSKLNPDKMVRTILPKDLRLVDEALETLNNGLNTLRSGKSLDYKDFYDESLNKAGIDLKEDGKLYHIRFKNGGWGEGEGKTSVKNPITFKKTIEEFGWDKQASGFAQNFLSKIRAVKEDTIKGCVNRHFADIRRAVNTAGEKGDAKVGRSVVLNQLKNLLTIRDTMLKFYFVQLKKVASAYKEAKEDKKEFDGGSGYEI